MGRILEHEFILWASATVPSIIYRSFPEAKLFNVTGGLRTYTMYHGMLQGAV